MFSLFGKKKARPGSVKGADFSFLECDMHSHLIPGIDDGSQSLADSIQFIERLSRLGFRHIITTPHIHGEMYDNDTKKIQNALKPLKQYLEHTMPEMSISVSAEYFLDAYFMEKVLPAGLMPFGNNQVLVEVSMAGWPRNLMEMLFALQSNGYTPILAHPERYTYEMGTEIYANLKDKGIQLQLNLLSVTGYYGRTVQHMAWKLMDLKLYDFCGTDLHHERHIGKIEGMSHEHLDQMERLYDYGFKNKELYG